MAAAAVLPPPAATSSLATKTDTVVRHKDTVRVSVLTNRPINPTKPPKVDVYWCEPCKIKLTNPLASLKHFTGPEHSQAVSKATAEAKKATPASKNADLKRKQVSKASAPPAKVAKGNASSTSAGAAAAKKKPISTLPAKTNVNRGAKRGGGAAASSSRGSFNNRNNFNNRSNNYNNNNNYNQRSNFNGNNSNNQRGSNFLGNNLQRTSNFNDNNNQRSLNLGGFNLSRNNQNDNSYPQSYIRESAGMNKGMGGNNSYTWQQQQQFGAEINNMLQRQQQFNNLSREVSNLEMLQQRLMRAGAAAGMQGGGNSNNNRGSLPRGNNYGGDRSRRDGFWGR